MYKHDKRVENKDKKIHMNIQAYYYNEIIIDPHCFQIIIQNTAVCV